MEGNSTDEDCDKFTSMKYFSGNKRKFVKNRVRTLAVGDVLFYKNMNKLLPKESERGVMSSIYIRSEIFTTIIHNKLNFTPLALLWRLESEADRQRNVEAEEIFTQDIIGIRK